MKDHEISTSSSPAHTVLREITLRGLILGTLLTVILAAANAYIGLKLGATVSASIPAAVISMGILRFFRDSSILENNMVQTMASVGEALTAGVAFILPALIITGAWQEFNYWQTMVVSLLGGFLGVLFTIPLRRALLQDPSLRYPEGTAIGNVLKASEAKESADLHSLVKGGVVGALIALFQSGFQILTDSIDWWFKTSTTIFGFGLGLSPALIAAGYIVGLNIALSLLLGIVIGWLAGIPILTIIYGMPDVETAAQAATLIWQTRVRYIGVGVMLVGGLWTLCVLAKPVISSMAVSFSSLRHLKTGEKAKLARTERDIPIHYVFISIFILLMPIFFLIAYYIMPALATLSTPLRLALAGFSTFYILIAGFIFCSISAYFAGLIGSTNNPVSGLLVSALLLLCLALMGVVGMQVIGEELAGLLTVVAIGSTVMIAVGLAISNDTMQDLKVGQIVGSTPWKQQLMLFFGVIISALVVPPILQLLYQAYGIGGVFPRAGMDPAQMLAAPQAGLMAAVAQGVFSHQLPWAMINTGAVIAVFCIIIDEVLKRQYGTRCPVLAVGLGIYLPLSASIPCVIGGVLSYLVQGRLNQYYRRGKQANEEKMQVHRHRGMLLACGIVAGASIMGVLLAIPFAIKENSDALRLMPENLASYSGGLSVIVTFFFCAWIYRLVLKR